MRILLALLAALLAGGAWMLVNSDNDFKIYTVLPGESVIPKETAQPSLSPIPKPTIKPEFVLHDVPFVAQAPTGAWSDPRQQDGCEEAASYMAVLWARGELPPETLAKKVEALLEISDWESQNYDEYHDTSALDTGERI